MSCIFDKLWQMSFKVVIDNKILCLFPYASTKVVLIFSLKMHVTFTDSRKGVPDHAQEQVISWISTFSFCLTLKEVVWVSPVQWLDLTLPGKSFYFSFHSISVSISCFFHMPMQNGNLRFCVTKQSCLSSYYSASGYKKPNMEAIKPPVFSYFYVLA